eukprot:GEMP01040241.1.p1 GENE.GEMP01040241.1~~GEMP01040241.1.p1  ORF type:complete len:291 (+),score=32.76 GEMP01040241.1:75-947(+)
MPMSALTLFSYLLSVTRGTHDATISSSPAPPPQGLDTSALPPPPEFADHSESFLTQESFNVGDAFTVEDTSYQVVHRLPGEPHTRAQESTGNRKILSIECDENSGLFNKDFELGKLKAECGKLEAEASKNLCNNCIMGRVKGYLLKIKARCFMGLVEEVNKDTQDLPDNWERTEVDGQIKITYCSKWSCVFRYNQKVSTTHGTVANEPLFKLVRFKTALETALVGKDVDDLLEHAEAARYEYVYLNEKFQKISAVLQESITGTPYFAFHVCNDLPFLAKTILRIFVHGCS